MTRAIDRAARSGYLAALRGNAACPWAADDARATAWSSGHVIGNLPRAVRWLFAWVLL